MKNRVVSQTFTQLLFLAASLTFPLILKAQTDDFDDGDDDFLPVEWTHYDAINTLSGGSSGVQDTWSFPSGGYRFEAVPSPSPGTYGPARVSSFPANTYSNFYVSVDVTSWNSTYSQAFGLLARVGDFSTAGSPTTRGYGFIYVNGSASASGLGYDNFIAIFRLQNDASTSGVHGSGTNVAEIHGVNLDPSKDYRLVFIGQGTHMEGRVYQLPNLDTPIAVVSANSAGETPIHTEGQSGILAFNVADASGAAFSGPVDVTFDNYVAAADPQLVCGINPPIVSDDFNDANDGGWTHYPTPQDLLQTWSFPTNPASSGNFAYRMTSSFGTTLANFGRVAGIRDGDPDSSDFCIEADLIDWENTASQNMGILARVQPGYQGTPVPHAYALVYANRASSGNGGTDQMRLYELLPNPGNPLNAASIFLHQGQGNLGQFGVVSGGSLAPAPSGNYRLVFKGVGNVLTGQIIDLSTGLPMTFNAGDNVHLTNMVATSWATNLVKGKTGLVTYQGSGNPGPNTAPDATFDNFVAGPTAPTVVIAPNSGTVKVSWPAQQEGIWVLESSPALGSGASWTEITAEKITFTNGQNVYTVTSPAGNRFLRLRKV